MSFMISAFLAGVGGGLYASYIGTIGPDVFQISRTYDILMIVVMGGMGSITGSVVAAFIVTIGQEWLRVLDGPITWLPFWPEDGVAGMRMVVFSLLLLIIILFFRNGLFGNREVTWGSIADRLSGLAGHKEKKAAPAAAQTEVSQSLKEIDRSLKEISQTLKAKGEIPEDVGQTLKEISATLEGIGEASKEVDEKL